MELYQEMPSGPAPLVLCAEEQLFDDEGVSASVSEPILERSAKKIRVQSGPTDPTVVPADCRIEVCHGFEVQQFINTENTQQDHHASSHGGACCTSVDAPSTAITASQRATIVDSMIAVAGSLQLSNAALFLAVACLDKYLSAVPTPRELLQPLSITCLWVAAKYDSAIVPRAAVFASFVIGPCGNTLSSTAVAIELLTHLEASLLKTLDYRLASIETTKSQVQEIMHKLQASPKTAGPSRSQAEQQELYCMMSYLAEVGLLEYHLLPCPADHLAAASYAFAHILLGRHLDMDLLVMITGYTFPQLHGTLQYLCALHTTLIQALHNGRPYSVSAKYAAPAVHAVAWVPPLCDTRDPRLAL